mmetsp:Transcript_39250/g.114650  ORF Transcript_39250/g.114650 Transcript_39250/m.114650 type:complete len:257 (-) Transcript_39250:642-1412(-)
MHLHCSPSSNTNSLLHSSCLVVSLSPRSKSVRGSWATFSSHSCFVGCILCPLRLSCRKRCARSFFRRRKRTATRGSVAWHILYWARPRTPWLLSRMTLPLHLLEERPVLPTRLLWMHALPHFARRSLPIHASGFRLNRLHALCCDAVRTPSAKQGCRWPGWRRCILPGGMCCRPMFMMLKNCKAVCWKQQVNCCFSEQASSLVRLTFMKSPRRRRAVFRQCLRPPQHFTTTFRYWRNTSASHVACLARIFVVQPTP